MERIALSEESRVRVVLVAVIAVIAVAGYALFDDGAPGAKADVEGVDVTLGSVTVVGDGVRVDVRLTANRYTTRYNRLAWWVVRPSDDTVVYCFANWRTIGTNNQAFTFGGWLLPGNYEIWSGWDDEAYSASERSDCNDNNIIPPSIPGSHEFREATFVVPYFPDATATPTPLAPTHTPTSTPIPTDTPTPTQVPPTHTPTSTPIPTDTPTPTQVPPTHTPTSTPIPEDTATPTMLPPTNTPTSTPTATPTPIAPPAPTKLSASTFASGGELFWSPDGHDPSFGGVVLDPATVDVQYRRIDGGDWTTLRSVDPYRSGLNMYPSPRVTGRYEARARFTFTGIGAGGWSIAPWAVPDLRIHGARAWSGVADPGDALVLAVISTDGYGHAPRLWDTLQLVITSNNTVVAVARASPFFTMYETERGCIILETGGTPCVGADAQGTTIIGAYIHARGHPAPGGLSAYLADGVYTGAPVPVYYDADDDLEDRLLALLDVVGREWGTPLVERGAANALGVDFAEAVLPPQAWEAGLQSIAPLTQLQIDTGDGPREVTLPEASQNPGVTTLSGLSDVPETVIRGLIIAALSIGFVVFASTRAGPKGALTAASLALAVILPVGVVIAWIPPLIGLTVLAGLGVLAVMRTINREAPA